MKYKVGDKVRIKSKEWFDKQPKNKNGNVVKHNSYAFTETMSMFCGLDATIIEVRNTSYDIDVDDEFYNWEDWMLEGDSIPKHATTRRKFSKIGNVIY